MVCSSANELGTGAASLDALRTKGNSQVRDLRRRIRDDAMQQSEDCSALVQETNGELPGRQRPDAALETKGSVLQLDPDPHPDDVRFAFTVRLGCRKWGVSPKSESPPGPIPLVWTVVSGLKGISEGRVASASCRPVRTVAWMHRGITLATWSNEGRGSHAKWKSGSGRG